MIKNDGSCDKVCEGCEFENEALECLIVLLLETKVAVIEMLEPGDTLSKN